PSLPRAHTQLGIAYLGQKQETQAEDQFRKALWYQPGDNLARFHLGKLYFAREEFGNAKWQLEKVVKVDPKNTEAHQMLGEIYTKTGKTEKATDAIGKSIQLEGASSIIGSGKKYRPKPIKIPTSVPEPPTPTPEPDWTPTEELASPTPAPTP